MTRPARRSHPGKPRRATKYRSMRPRLRRGDRALRGAPASTAIECHQRRRRRRAAAYAALRSAALNVFINAPALKNRAFAEQAVREINQLLARSASESEAVYALVRGKLGG